MTATKARRGSHRTPILLRGMTWDHVRGRAPLEAAAASFSRMHPSVLVTWDARSLKDFEDYPLEELASTYDLIMIDHPFVGAAARARILEPLDEWLDTRFLADQGTNSVGPSHRSYRWRGAQLALAVDAAAQVAAYREDLLAGLATRPPTTWKEVLDLATDLADGQTRVSLPLNPNHAYCAFLSLCANIAGPDFWALEKGIARDLGGEALAMLARLTRVVHPASRYMDPIQMSDHMANTDDICYAPLMFGYSNYARAGFRPNRLRFCDIPSTVEEPVGAVLGGVGLAISVASRHKDIAAQFAAYVASAHYQKGEYFASGGQPGHRAAWTDHETNRLTGDFFGGTLRTLDRASMRPRVPGHLRFQEEAGLAIHAFLWDQSSATPAECVREFNALASRCLDGTPGAAMAAQRSDTQ